MPSSVPDVQVDGGLRGGGGRAELPDRSRWFVFQPKSLFNRKCKHCGERFKQHDRARADGKHPCRNKGGGGGAGEGAKGSPRTGGKSLEHSASAPVKSTSVNPSMVKVGVRSASISSHGRRRSRSLSIIRGIVNRARRGSVGSVSSGSAGGSGFSGVSSGGGTKKGKTRQTSKTRRRARMMAALSFRSQVVEFNQHKRYERQHPTMSHSSRS